MKLSKKIAVTYGVALIVGVCVCVTFLLGFQKRAIEGEKLRSKEITTGVRARFNEMIGEMDDEISFYNELIDIQKDDEYKDVIDVYINNIFNANIIDFKCEFNSENNSTKNIFFKDDSYLVVYEAIIEKVNSGILNDGNSSSGAMCIDENYYGVSYKQLDEYNNYILFAKKIDANILAGIGKSTNSKVELANEPYKDNKTKIITPQGVEYIFEYGTDTITSHSVVNSINSEDEVFIRVKQTKEVQNEVHSKFTLFLIIVISVAISINIILYIFINKKIIKRILSVNDSVHNISGDDYKLKRISPDCVNDEISDLTTNINNMLERVNSANLKVTNSESKHRGIINTMTNGFIYCKVIRDRDYKAIDGEIIDINKAASNMLNITRWEGEKITTILHEDIYVKEIILKNLNEIKVNSQVMIDKEIEFASKNWGVITINKIEEGFFFIIINDVTKIKLNSEKMEYLANYDELTSIYNRRKLIKYIEELEQGNIEYNFLFIDLDNFKGLNDSLGHEEGDLILKEVSKILLKFASDTVKIGRLGGDEFVVIKVGKCNKSDLKGFANEIIKSLNKKYEFEKFTYNLKLSIGIATFPKDGCNSNTIIKHADIAMYNSKLKGGNTVSIFDENILAAHELESKIKDGIDKKEFKAYYQPIYNIKKNRIDGVEALVRWDSDESVIEPDKFIRVAKRNGLMAKIDKFVFVSACRFSKECKEKFDAYISISVNISHSLLMKKEFVEFILTTAERIGVPNKYIKLEITEDEIIGDIKYVVSILEYLRTRGIKIALDDFGTGYSSYSYVNILPLDIIKIDRSLIVDIEDNEKNVSIIKSLMELSKILDVEVTCEGIENKNQLKILSNLGCDRIQGYFFSRPINRESTFEYIKKFNK